MKMPAAAHVIMLFFIHPPLVAFACMIKYHRKQKVADHRLEANYQILQYRIRLATFDGVYVARVDRLNELPEAEWFHPERMVAVFSNGKFDGAHDKMLHRFGKAG